MTRCCSLKTGLRVLAVVSAIAGLAPAAQALAPGGSVDVGSWTRSAGVESALNTCLILQATAGGSKLLRQGCTVPNGGTAATGNQASFQAPSVFDPGNPAGYQLASLGARSTLEVEVHSDAGGTGRSHNDPRTALEARADASYIDYLMLGTTRPNRLVLDFHLSGDFRIDPVLGQSVDPVRTDATYTVGAQSGHTTFAGDFASYDPFAMGSVQVHRQLERVTGLPTVTRTVYSDPAGALTHLENRNVLGGIDVQVTLGSAFFSNRDNNLVALRLSLSSFAYGAAWTFAPLEYGTVRTGNVISADFASTFQMVGLQAFDANGLDITADAVLGFASLQPVPEPQTWWLLAAGLVGVALRRRSQRLG